MYRQGFSNIISGAIIILLLIILTSYSILYLNNGLNMIKDTTYDSKKELEREIEFIRVYQNSSLIKIVNEGSKIVKVRGILVEYGNGSTSFIELPLTLKVGDYYIYDTSSIGRYKQIYILTDSGKIYSPIPYPKDIGVNNEVILMANNTILLSNRKDVKVLYIPNSTLYLSTVYRNYEIDLQKDEILYFGSAKVYVSKNKDIVMTSSAIYRNSSLVYNLIGSEADIIYIGWDFLVFKIVNPLDPYNLDKMKIYIVSNERLENIGNSLTSGVSGEYVYYLDDNYVVRKDGKILYPLYVIGEHYSSLKKFYLLIDFPIEQLEVFINDDGFPIRLIGRFSPYENGKYNEESNIETFTYNLKLIGYLENIPIYTRVEDTILNSFSSNLDTDFLFNGSLYGEYNKTIWGIINNTAGDIIDGTNITTIQYKYRLPINGIIHGVLYNRFAFEKLIGNLLYPRISSTYDIIFTFDPLNVSLGMSFQEKLTGKYVNGVLKVTMSNHVSIYLSNDSIINEIFDDIITTGIINYNKLGSCHQAYYSDILIGLNDKDVFIYISLFKSYKLSDLQSSRKVKEKTYSEYEPQLIFNKTLKLHLHPNNIVLKVINHTRIIPGDSKDIYSTFLSLPIYSLSKNSLSTFPENYLKYARLTLRLPNMYVILNPLEILYYPPIKPVSYSDWDYSYIYPPTFFYRLGWKYVFLYEYRAGNQFYGSILFYLNNYTIKPLYRCINKIGIWFIDYSTGSYDFLYQNIGSIDGVFDYGMILSPHKAIICIPTGYGHRIILEDY